MTNYFNFRELTHGCTDSERINLISDNAKTKNLFALCQLLNQVRELFGLPVIVNSGYRDAKHNARVGGVSTSEHLLAAAADIRVQKTSTEYLAPSRVCDMLKKSNIAYGQLIEYDNFTHISLPLKHHRQYIKKTQS